MADDELLIERLLRVIDEGRRTATYKLALLLAIIDAAAMSPGQSDLSTRLLAERALELYYPQTRSYTDRFGVAHQPRQIAMKQAAVLTAIEQLRTKAEVRGCRGLGDVQRRLPADYERTLTAVEETFVRYPIPLLQMVGAKLVPFLYPADWPEGASLKSVRRDGLDRIRLFPGVADRLVTLGPMLRPLIEIHWVRDVARWSQIAVEDELLHSHLFGRTRASFPRPLTDGLRELQDNRCFYCYNRLTNRVYVDHFLPWSRWPTDAVENLVAADACNGAKSDHLVAAVHLIRWRARLDRSSGALGDLAETSRWTTAPERTAALAESTYRLLAPGTPLWLRDREFELASGPTWV